MIKVEVEDEVEAMGSERDNCRMFRPEAGS